jgi:hypothetical protein
MANPRIEVEIGANVAGLTTGVNTATGQLDKLGKAAQATAPQVQKLTQATQGYNSVGVDFARIIQDAPFGIIGVGNNITQLAGSFQVLKNQTGSTGGALKAALGSILSSGNALVLGISVLTTAFTILQQKGFFKSEEAAKSLNEQLADYRENLDGITKATLEGTISAQKEISNLKLLQIQAENTNLSLEKRLAAVNEIRKLAPEYLKNLSDEEILAGKVGDAYNKLTNDILALAKAKAFSAQIDKNTADSLTLLLQEEERAILISQKRQDQERARREDEQRRSIGAAAGAAGSAAISEAAGIESEINDLIKEQVQSANERVKLTEQNLKLEAQIVGFSSQGATFAKVKIEDAKAVNVEKEKELKLEDELITQTELGNKLRNEAFDKLKTITSELAPSLGKLQEIDLSKIQIAPEIADIDDSKLTAFVLRLAQFNSEVAGVIEGGAQQTIGDFAFAIGDALGSGGNVLKAAGSALLGGLASILNQLGQLAIGTGLAIAGIKKALQTLNPAVAIGAGVALIALAGFVSSKAKSLGGSSGGSGGASGGGGSSVGSSGVGGGTAFTGGGAQGGLFEQNRDVSGEFVVRGQDLVYVLGQANNRINKG